MTRTKSLGKNVNHLINRRDIPNHKVITMNLFMDKVIVHLDVLGALMKY